MAKGKQPVEDDNNAVVTQTKSLLSVLKKVRAAVDRRGTIGVEQAKHFIFDNDLVIAYNDSISISAPLGTKTGLQLTVQADALYKVLSDIPDDDVSLDLDDKNNLLIESKTTKAGLVAHGLATDMKDLLDSLKLDKLEDWGTLPDDFIDAVHLCSVSVSRDRHNVGHGSLRVHSDRILSTENWRISRYTFAKTKGRAKMDFMLPWEAAKELIKFKITEVAHAKPWIHFRDEDGLVFSSRTPDTDLFPECEKFIALKGTDVELPPGLAEAMNAVRVFAVGDEDDELEVVLTFKKGKVLCRTQRPEGWIERTVYMPGLSVPESAPTIKVNPVYFMEILSKTTTMTVGDGKALFVTSRFDHIMKLPPDAH